MEQTGYSFSDSYQKDHSQSDIVSTRKQAFTIYFLATIWWRGVSYKVSVGVLDGVRVLPLRVDSWEGEPYGVPFRARLRPNRPDGVAPKIRLQQLRVQSLSPEVLKPKRPTPPPAELFTGVLERDSRPWYYRHTDISVIGHGAVPYPGI